MDARTAPCQRARRPMGQPASPAQETCAFKVRPDCGQLFILYTGMAGQMMLPPMHFIQQAQILDRNLMILRDLNHCCYQRGISLRHPTIPSFLRWQRETLKLKFPKVNEVYCIGSSGGAYAALLSGHFLKVKKVWAFAPPVPVQPTDRIAYVDPEFSDLGRVLAADNGTTQYEIFFNESEQTDRLAAERLRELPGVTLSPQAGEGHGVVVHLAQTGQLGRLLPEFTSC
ncbi:MAG TPA: hypothetical protein VHO25_11535 [Polyangiaceae bacterium]|nr:hypothetical protein [Polyangiaceae bacterium]